MPNSTICADGETRLIEPYLPPLVVINGDQEPRRVACVIPSGLRRVVFLGPSVRVFTDTLQLASPGIPPKQSQQLDGNASVNSTVCGGFVPRASLILGREF